MIAETIVITRWLKRGLRESDYEICLRVMRAIQQGRARLA